MSTEFPNIPEASHSKPVWLRMGTLIDGSMHVLKDAHLVYDAGGVRYVGISSPPAEELRPGQIEPDLHAPEHTLLPGLIESHAHLFLEGGELDFGKRADYLRRPSDELLACARRRLLPLVQIGISAVRDAGDKDGVGLALSQLSASLEGRPPMPSLDSPGAAIHHKGRYGSFMGEPIEDHPSPETCVEDRVKKGADRIKIIPTGIINFKKGLVTAAPQMDTAEVRAIVEAARSHGRQSFAHASGDDGIEHALEGGVDTIEHGFFIREDQLSRLRDRDIGWVPTFAPVQKQVDHAALFKWESEIVAHLQRILDQHAASLRKAHEMGVRIIAGSDAGSCGVDHGFGFLYELELMEQAGLPSLAVLHAATGAPAERLNFREPVGRILPGCRSRFILTRHSPLASIRNLRQDRTIIFDGKVFHTEASYQPGEL